MSYADLDGTRQRAPDEPAPDDAPRSRVVAKTAFPYDPDKACAWQVVWFAKYRPQWQATRGTIRDLVQSTPADRTIQSNELPVNTGSISRVLADQASRESERQRGWFIAADGLYGPRSPGPMNEAA